MRYLVKALSPDADFDAIVESELNRIAEQHRGTIVGVWLPPGPHGLHGLRVLLAIDDRPDR